VNFEEFWNENRQRYSDAIKSCHKDHSDIMHAAHVIAEHVWVESRRLACKDLIKKVDELEERLTI